MLRIEPGGDESLTTQDDVVCLANAGSHDVEFIDSFHAVARSLHGELTFGLALRDTDDNLNVKSTIECRRQRDDKTKVYTHDGTGGEDIKAWILEATRPTIADLTPYNHQRLLDVGDAILGCTNTCASFSDQSDSATLAHDLCLREQSTAAPRPSREALQLRQILPRSDDSTG